MRSRTDQRPLCSLCRTWLTLDIIEPLGAERFFEVGFGRGDISIALAQTGLCRHGIEQSPEAVDLCRERISNAGLDDRLSVDTQDLFTLDRQGEYDLANAYEVLERPRVAASHSNL
ncbi:MAG: methyltransferase domain-containing protein [Chloroflexi bacterium]|nr:methyltransferase domain-containing protein [Chloroflexota bacterium]